MQKALVHFKGLYGDNPHSLLPNFIHFEALETRSKIYDWEIKEHLHTDLLLIIKNLTTPKLNFPCMQKRMIAY